MADNKARQYTNPTIKKLFSRSGNRCAFPDCDVIFFSEESENNLSNICHIEDANPNTHKADRYNPAMTDDQRRDYNNLILLCPNHHKITDDLDIYTVQALKNMKSDHEDWVRENLKPKDAIAKYPQVLNIVINILGSSLFAEGYPKEPLTAPDPEGKIIFNNIIRYKSIIEEYKVYQGRLNSAYEEIEKQGSALKANLLLNIKSLYLKEKQNYNGITEIRANADSIIEKILSILLERIEKSSNADPLLPFEVIENYLFVIMVDAFMRCNILEEPH